MLTRLLFTASALTIGSVGLLTAASVPAAAGPCPGGTSGGGKVGACVGTGVDIPGNDSGGGTGSGGNAPLPNVNCPQIGGVVVCTGGNPPPAAHTPTLSLVSRALDSRFLTRPHISNAPDPRTYVRVTTYLWLGRDDLDDVVADAKTDPGEAFQHVTVTAHADDVVWDMGESKTYCKGPGAPESPSCSYTYKRSSSNQPYGAYSISATIIWKIHWNCDGPGCDNAGDNLADQSTSSSKQLIVGEIQANTQPKN